MHGIVHKRDEKKGMFSWFESGGWVNHECGFE